MAGRRSTPEPISRVDTIAPIYRLAFSSGSLVRGPVVYHVGQNDAIASPSTVRRT